MESLCQKWSVNHEADLDNFNTNLWKSVRMSNLDLNFARVCEKWTQRGWSFAFESISKTACTWLLLRELTPSLTRLRETLEAVELMELTESWLPLRSRDNRRLVFIRDRDWGLGVDADILLVMLPDVSRVTLWTGANSPNIGRHSKYLPKF